MDQVFQYEIPVLHPVVVHFPIVLVLLAAVAAVVWLLRDRMAWLVAASYIQAVGLIGSVIAFLSGEALEEQSEGVPIVDELVDLHEEAALVAAWLIGISVAAFLAATYLTRRDTSRPGSPFWLRTLATLLAAAAAVAVAWTAHIGGTMVWGVVP